MMTAPTITSINLELKLLRRIQKIAYAKKQSLSQWISEAAAQRFERESKA